jgi:TRAP-type C4-dicarboxylate transport system permease small subunit
VAAVLAALIGALAALNAPLAAVCRLATVGLLAAIALVVAIGVFWRYVLGDALSWYEEIAKILMLWLTFVAAPLALPAGGHVAVEILPGALPRRARHALVAATLAVVAVLAGWLVWYGAAFAWNGRLQVSPTVGEISMTWIFASMPVGALLILLTAVELTLRHLAHALDPIRHPAPAAHDAAAASWS